MSAVLDALWGPLGYLVGAVVSASALGFFLAVYVEEEPYNPPHEFLAMLGGLLWPLLLLSLPMLVAVKLGSIAKKLAKEKRRIRVEREEEAKTLLQEAERELERELKRERFR